MVNLLKTLGHLKLQFKNTMGYTLNYILSPWEITRLCHPDFLCAQAIFHHILSCRYKLSMNYSKYTVSIQSPINTKLFDFGKRKKTART